jgi:hypothetical protein
MAESKPRTPQSGTEVLLYRIKNLKQDGTLKKFTVVRMCGSSKISPEWGVFVDGKIKLNFGYDLDGWAKKMDNHFWVFWWVKR